MSKDEFSLFGTGFIFIEIQDRYIHHFVFHTAAIIWFYLKIKDIWCSSQGTGRMH